MVKGIICCFAILYLVVTGYVVLNKNSVNSAVFNVTVSKSDAINEAIPSVKPKISTFPHWFSKY
jgi:hypothetical protein